MELETELKHFIIVLTPLFSVSFSVELDSSMTLSTAELKFSSEPMELELVLTAMPTKHMYWASS